MLHLFLDILFLDRGPWFRAKSYGYGAALPFKWQGWALLAAHMAVLFGIVAAFAGHPIMMMVLISIAAIAPFPLYRARTEGGWRWRMGGVDEDTQNG